MTRRPSPRRLGGFTLIEVVVALILLSLTLWVMFHLGDTVMRQAGSAKLISEATHLARAQLARIGSEVPLRPGRFERWSNGMMLTTTIRLADMADGAGGMVLYHIEVTAAFGEREAEKFKLVSMQIGPDSRDEGS